MDNSFIIDNLLQQQEGTRLEYMAKPTTEAIAKTITAFINTQGGDLLIGVEDNKKVVGIENAEKSKVVIQRILIETIKPIAPISVQVINYKKKDLILISVWEGAKKPYQFKGKIYSRENDATKISNLETLSSLINQRKKADFDWERRTVLGATINDLDIEEINQTITLYRAYKPNSVIEDAEDFLYQMGLLQSGSLTNAAIVLFGKKPARFIPQSRIRLTVYPSNKSGDVFLNDRIFEGNIFKNIATILDFVAIYFGKKLIVDGNIRTEKTNYPLFAMREGILNAIVHRDYNSVNGFMQISIFSDRTEIANYGGLPKGITIKDLKKEHNSVLRNPDIAQICFIRKYIEMLGSGTLRMINDCKSNGFKTPVWTDKDDVTTVVFPELTMVGVASEGINEGVNEGVNKVVFDNESEGVNEDLNTVLNLIGEEPGINAPRIAELVQKGLSTVERYIKKLRDQNYIEFRGAAKNGGYYRK